MRKILLLILSVALMLANSELWAQERTVTGRVTAIEDGSALPGVNVVLKGTSTGTVTDVDGRYTLSVPSTGGTLVFTFIGLSSKELEIGTQSTVNVQMTQDIQQLTEVVVTANNIERSEKSLGYAVTQVNAQDVTQGRSTNPMASLQGKIAGVNISTASGAPGASTKVIIRGYSSIGGNNNPLYVVDGVPINNSSNNFMDPNNSVNRTQDFGNRANDINPDDIESISILKGAAAAGLYGSRAANGVIMITTKRGKAGDRVKVDFTSSATFTTPLRVPQLQNTFGQGWSGHFAFEENGSWGPKMDGKERVWGNIVDNSQQIKPFSPQKNNLLDFYDVGKAFINSLALSGGTEKANYYLSYSNVSEDGIVPTDNDSYKRNTLSFRGATSMGKFTSSASINYVNKAGKFITTGQGGDGTTVFQEIIQIPRDMSIVDMGDYKSKFYNLDNNYNLYAQNPFWALNENSNDFQENRIYGNFSLEYDFKDWLKGTLRVGGDVANSGLLDWIAIAKTDPGSPNATIQQIPGRTDERTRFARELYGDFILSANNTLSERFKLTSLVGYNVQDRSYKDLHTWITNLSIPGFYNLSNSSLPPSSTTLITRRRLIGVYGQATLAYNDYLFLTLQARNDWSSTLPKESRSYFYPGANLSFVFTDAFKISGPISSGKVRVSYGKTGNDANPYAVYSTMVASNIGLPFGDIDFPLKGVNAFEVSNQLGNANLKPELSTEFEFGANVQFFNDRLGFDLAFYDKKTTDQILAVPLATTSGYTTQILNFGKIQNKGFELLVTGSPVKTSNFSWDIAVNYTQNEGKVLALREGLDRVTLTGAYGVDFVAEVGSPLGTFYGPQPLRDAEGRVVVNTSGIPVADPEKAKYGDAQADFVMGINNQLNYKNFGLSFGFDIRKGGLIYSYTKQLNYFVGNATNTLYNERQPFMEPNSVYQPVGDDGKPLIDDNGDAVYRENIYPVDMTLVSDYWNPNTNQSKFRDMVIDRSYVKLREVVISYSLPTRWLSKTPISSLTLSLVGRNLLLWTPKENNVIDPEVTTFGNDLTGDFGEFAAGPTVRSMGASLKASF